MFVMRVGTEEKSFFRLKIKRILNYNYILSIVVMKNGT